MSERVRRGCAVVAKVVLAGAVGLAVWVYLSLRPEPQPDVGKAAHSATARAADRALTVQLDGQIDRLRAALPWAAYLGTTVADVCTTDSTTTAFTFTRQRWLPVTCTRTTTMYEAFDGDFLERLGQLDAALTAAQWRADWKGYPSYPRPRPGLVAAYDYSRPSPTSGAPDGAPLPGSASVRYDVPITSDFVPPADSMTRGKPSGSVEVVRARTCRTSTTARPRTTPRSSTRRSRHITTSTGSSTATRGWPPTPTRRTAPSSPSRSPEATTPARDARPFRAAPGPPAARNGSGPGPRRWKRTSDRRPADAGEPPSRDPRAQPVSAAGRLSRRANRGIPVPGLIRVPALRVAPGVGARVAGSRTRP